MQLLCSVLTSFPKLLPTGAAQNALCGRKAVHMKIFSICPYSDSKQFLRDFSVHFLLKKKSLFWRACFNSIGLYIFYSGPFGSCEVQLRKGGRFTRKQQLQGKLCRYCFVLNRDAHFFTEKRHVQFGEKLC